MTADPMDDWANDPEGRGYEHAYNQEPPPDYDYAPPAPDEGAYEDAQDDAERRREAVLAQFPATSIQDLLDPNRPTRRWAIEGLVPDGAAVSISAPPGSFKSLLVLGIALAVAQGSRRFAGLNVDAGRRVLYLDYESTDDDLADRLSAYGITQRSNIGEFYLLRFPGLDPLDSVHGGVQLEAILNAYGLQAGDVLIEDSCQRMLAGPEDKSDTFRDYYRCTGAMLKRRGITVIRLDNTGKDVSKGARGSSSKNDDVDLAWVAGRDGNRMTLSPVKQRVDVKPLIFTRHVDETDGHLWWTSADDPERVAMWEAVDAMDELKLDDMTAERPAKLALDESGKWPKPGDPKTTRITRKAIRDAVKLRKSRPPSDGGNDAPDTPKSAPRTDGACPENKCAEPERRNTAQHQRNEPNHATTREDAPEGCAETLMRTPAQGVSRDAPNLRNPIGVRKAQNTRPANKKTATCEACGEPMTITVPGQTCHPCCERSGVAA